MPVKVTYTAANSSFEVDFNYILKTPGCYSLHENDTKPDLISLGENIVIYVNHRGELVPIDNSWTHLTLWKLPINANFKV